MPTDNRTTGEEETRNCGGHAPRVVELGSFRVTALYDGHFDFPLEYLQSGDDRPAGTSGTFRADVNAFLVQTKDRNYLVDTGAGAKLGPDFNRLPTNLRAAGLEPRHIDAVLLTHIHPDHTNGLVDASNAPMFPNAQLFVHQNEIDFWLSDEGYAQAPADIRLYYDWLVRHSPPIRAAWNRSKAAKSSRGSKRSPCLGTRLATRASRSMAVATISCCSGVTQSTKYSASLAIQTSPSGWT